MLNRILFALLALVSISLVSPMARDDWAEKWCELNDCHGVQEAAKRSQQNAIVDKEIRKATRRYQATGEVRAIKAEAVQGAYFGYDGPVLDHPAFPGVAQEHAQHAERKHEAFAIQQRQQAERHAISPPEPSGGYLLPNTEEATQLAVRKQEETAIAMSRRRHEIMKEEVRIGCMLEYGQISNGRGGYYLSGKITTLQAPVKGCAAGSVWADDGRDGVYLASRTAESAGSVWRKVNGTDREWFENVNFAPCVLSPPCMLDLAATRRGNKGRGEDRKQESSEEMEMQEKGVRHKRRKEDSETQKRREKRGATREEKRKDGNIRQSKRSEEKRERKGRTHRHGNEVKDESRAAQTRKTHLHGKLRE